jgi:hypothetical protein
MHCELVVPGLLSSPPELRLPALELLLARGRRVDAPALTLEQWLLDAFALPEAPLAAGALTLLADGGQPGDARWVRADPIHMRMLHDRIVLVPSAGFSVSRDEAEALCEALNVHLAGVMTVHPLHPERWCARLEQALSVEAASPLELAGQDLEGNLPRGPHATRVHALLNEIQMALHPHPVNQAREARGEPPINSVWLWGEGTAPAGARGRWLSVSAGEPLALGLARLAGERARALPSGAGAWLERVAEDGRHLVVLDVLRAPHALEDSPALLERLRALEAGWFAPLLAMLRAERVGMLSIHIPDATGGASFETVRSDLRRFWRRPKALERYA